MENFLPPRIRNYLNNRGITDAVIAANSITWDGVRIVIPVFGKDGAWLFNKYRRDPEATEGPKYTYDAGSTAAMYGLNKVANAKQIVICEGEFDALILEAQGFVGVTSTGGAGTFRPEWAVELADKDVFVCFDCDAAGERGVMRIAEMIPSVKVMWLPTEVGEHGDITDFFMKLGRSKKEFEAMMQFATPLPPQKKKEPTSKRYRKKSDAAFEKAKAVPIKNFLKFNSRNFAICPFHKETTPSFHWYGENRFCCFGCGEKGDVIDFIMKRDSLSLKDAVTYLANI